MKEMYGLNALHDKENGLRTLQSTELSHFEDLICSSRNMCSPKWFLYPWFQMEKLRPSRVKGLFALAELELHFSSPDQGTSHFAALFFQSTSWFTLRVTKPRGLLFIFLFLSSFFFNYNNHYVLCSHVENCIKG